MRTSLVGTCKERYVRTNDYLHHAHLNAIFFLARARTRCTYLGTEVFM